ncbi:MAG: hydroxymethylglutaryl-CoA lyase [Hyphomicrobiaceae bacterium]
MSAVTIVEVAPRDGFQAVKPLIPTAAKIATIEALAAAGFRRMEIGAFVGPKAVPQMADTETVLAEAKLPAALRLQALVPNRKGLERAIAAGVREICWVISVSESHNRNNVRRSVADSFRDLEDAWRAYGGKNLFLRFSLATSFDCPFEGRTPEAHVVAGIERVLALTSEVEIALADTTGRAAPDHVRSLFGTVVRRYASDKVAFAFHGHDTYSLGVANALAAYEAGVRIFDGAAAGLGGCPFAPGASGNTASEDLVFAFEHMGVATGIDFAKLLAAADLAYRIAPEQAGGRLRGVPRRRALAGFGPAAKGLGM